MVTVGLLVTYATASASLLVASGYVDRRRGEETRIGMLGVDNRYSVSCICCSVDLWNRGPHISSVETR